MLYELSKPTETDVYVPLTDWKSTVPSTSHELKRLFSYCTYTKDFGRTLDASLVSSFARSHIFRHANLVNLVDMLCRQLFQSLVCFLHISCFESGEYQIKTFEGCWIVSVLIKLWYITPSFFLTWQFSHRHVPHKAIHDTFHSSIIIFFCDDLVWRWMFSSIGQGYAVCVQYVFAAGSGSSSRARRKIIFH